MSGHVVSDSQTRDVVYNTDANISKYLRCEWMQTFVSLENPRDRFLDIFLYHDIHNY